MEHRDPYILVLSPRFDQVLKSLKRKSPDILVALDSGVEKILREPFLGKPLRNTLRNYRRIHVAGSFVLLYEIQDNQVRLLDFDHHDRIYKKY
jgi:YafQ family addiction module toxin component